MAVDYDSKDYLKSVDAYWRAANYLSVGQLFLRPHWLQKTLSLSQLVTGALLHHRTLFMLT